MKKSLGDILGDAWDLFGRVWKPLVIGFGVFNLVGALPMWALEFGQSRLYASLASKQNLGLSSITEALPTIQLALGLGLIAIFAYVLAYNFAIAKAQSVFTGQDAGPLFLPAMGTLGWFGLIYLVPIAIVGLSLYKGVQAFQQGGFGTAILLFVLAVLIRLLCAPFLLLCTIIPATIGAQGRVAFKRAFEFVGENLAELFVIALLFVCIAFGTALMTMLLEAPLPAATDKASINDMLNLNTQTAVELLLKPDNIPVWVTSVERLIGVVTSSLSQSFSVCIIAAWFVARTGDTPAAWPKINA
jgi:hypothetical protein